MEHAIRAPRDATVRACRTATAISSRPARRSSSSPESRPRRGGAFALIIPDMDSWPEQAIRRPHLPERVTVYEVGPRDGLQNEAETVPVAGTRRVHRPADGRRSFGDRGRSRSSRPGGPAARRHGGRLSAGSERPRGVRYPVLVPNEKGLDRAIAAGALEIAVFTAASETFNRHNINAGVDESIERFRPSSRARARRRRSACAATSRRPSDAPTRATSRPRRCARSSTSCSTSASTRSRSATRSASRRRSTSTRSIETLYDSGVSRGILALHFHDTRGTALANVFAGLECGVTTFDSSAGGLGGCPYAPGASGNLATEDLLYLLDGLGVETGVSLPEGRRGVPLSRRPDRAPPPGSLSRGRAGAVPDSRSASFARARGSSPLTVRAAKCNVLRHSRYADILMPKKDSAGRRQSDDSESRRADVFRQRLRADLRRQRPPGDRARSRRPARSDPRGRRDAGEERLRSLRGDQGRSVARRDIPVILLTGTFEPFDRQRAERLGADAIVSKPFDSQQLLRAGRGAAGPRRLASAPPSDATVALRIPEELALGAGAPPGRGVEAGAVRRRVRSGRLHRQHPRCRREIRSKRSSAGATWIPRSPRSRVRRAPDGPGTDDRAGRRAERARAGDRRSRPGSRRSPNATRRRRTAATGSRPRFLRRPRCSEQSRRRPSAPTKRPTAEIVTGQFDLRPTDRLRAAADAPARPVEEITAPTPRSPLRRPGRQEPHRGFAAARQPSPRPRRLRRWPAPHELEALAQTSSIPELAQMLVVGLARAPISRTRTSTASPRGSSKSSPTA